MVAASEAIAAVTGGSPGCIDGLVATENGAAESEGHANGIHDPAEIVAHPGGTVDARVALASRGLFAAERRTLDRVQRVGIIFQGARGSFRQRNCRFPR